MATRSNISVKNNGEWHTIYCHFEGYPKHQFPILTKHYNTLEKALQLIELGDISSLGETIETCDAYHRDRGEEKVEPRKTFNEPKIEEEYLYMFDGECWTYR